MMKTEAIAKALIDSDRQYFELNAETSRVGPFQLARLPGFEALPAGLVCHQVAPVDDEAQRSRRHEWLDLIERSCSSWSNPLVRIYSKGCRAVQHLLEAHGYSCRQEIGFARTQAVQPTDRSFELCPIDDESGWQTKLEMHAESASVVDGHPCRPEQWVELERARSRSGRVRFYLVRQGDRIHGTLGLMRIGSVLRLKNLYLRPGSRGRGIGTATLNRVFERIDGQHIKAVVLLALHGQTGEHFYRKLGMQDVCLLHEWSRELK